MAKGTAGNRPGEFGGVPGLYGNADQPGGILEPWQVRMALGQTKSDEVESEPSHGDGGKKVQ